MPRPGEDRSDVGGAAQFNNIGPVPLSPLPLSPRPAFPASRFPRVPLSPRPAFPASRFPRPKLAESESIILTAHTRSPARCDRVRQWSSWSAMVWSC